MMTMLWDEPAIRPSFQRVGLYERSRMFVVARRPAGGAGGRPRRRFAALVNGAAFG